MKEESIKVHLFNVGAGDHLMIEFPDSSIGIIDSYFSYSGLKQKEPPALTYLKFLVAKRKKNKSKKRIKIAFLCLTHADQDHIKGINKLLNFLREETENIELENLLLFGGIDLRIYRSEIEKLNVRMIKYLRGDALTEFELRARRYESDLMAIDKFKLDWRERTKKTESYFNDSKEFSLYNSNGKYKATSLGPIARIIEDQAVANLSGLIGDLYERIQEFDNNIKINPDATMNLKFNRNTLSAMLSIYSYDIKLIFFGDATSGTIEASLLDFSKKGKKAQKAVFNPHFVKVSHHGSRSSTSSTIWDKLLSQTNEVFLGISAGTNKKNMHPHDELFTDVFECCQNKKIDFHLFRTNTCSSCKNKPAFVNEIDLDYWYQFHGSKVEDIRLVEAFYNDLPENYNIGHEVHSDKNLLSYIFEFPIKGLTKQIKVFKGVSSIVGGYESCVFGDYNDKYCN